MANYAIPLDISRTNIGFDLQMTGNVWENVSDLNKGLQTVEFPGDRWIGRIEFPPLVWSVFQRHEAFWNRFRGKAHRLQIWHLARPIPTGDLRGLPTVRGAHPRGSNTLALNDPSGTGTVKPGDMLGVILDNGTRQVVQVAEATGIGNSLLAELVAPLRRPAANGASVEWNRPLITAVLTSAPFPSYRAIIGEGYTVEFAELPQ